MKKLIFLAAVISSLCFYSAKAQDDSKAKTILNDLSASLKSYGLIKIDFSSKMENKTNNTNESKDGTIWLKGEKYRLEISGQTVICDGKTVWTYIKDANEVQINSVQPEEDAALYINTTFLIDEKVSAGHVLFLPTHGSLDRIQQRLLDHG